MTCFRAHEDLRTVSEVVRDLDHRRAAQVHANHGEFQRENTVSGLSEKSEGLQQEGSNLPIPLPVGLRFPATALRSPASA
jgi:hypothetical protein